MMRGKWFMQDGAPAHTKEYLKKRKIDVRPPKSLDLNPIERTFGGWLMKVHLNFNVQDLKAERQRVWDTTATTTTTTN
jgi:transposase